MRRGSVESRGLLPLPPETLPAQWKKQSAAFSVPKLIAQLADSPRGSAHHDLLTALQHAKVRAEHDPWGAPEHVRYAQAVLEIAVEWAMPAVERWAVAWLNAAGVSYLRLRWSSRSRDGRTRRDALVPSEVSAMAADSGRAIIGCESGFLAQWTDDAGLSTIRPPDVTTPAVWAVACRGDLVFAADARGRLVTRPDHWTVAERPENLNAVVRTAAISEDGALACGDNVGRLLICPAEREWLAPLHPPGPRRGASIVALSFDARSSVWAVWEDGWVTETWRGPDGNWDWRTIGQPQDRRVTAAAFDTACRRAAIGYTGGEVSVVHLPEMKPVPCWSQDGPGIARIRSAAWSPGGLLAVSTTGSLLFGEPDRQPEQISGDGPGGRVAFLDEDHLVTAGEREIVGWAIHDAGSGVRDPLQSAITAVAVDPLDPGRTMVGTARGAVLRYDQRGSATLLVKDDGPIAGQVHELTRMGDDWLVAAQGGAYRMTPDGDVSGLAGADTTASYLCLSVAATGQDGQPQDGVYACHDRVRAVSGGDLLTFASPVRDIRAGADGAVAAIADDGSICVRDRTGSVWSPPNPRPRPGRPGHSGWRLLAADATSVTVWNPVGRQGDPDGRVQRIARYTRDVQLARLPPDVTAALALGAHGGAHVAGIVMVCRGRGAALTSADGSPYAGPVTGVSTRATTIGAGGHRIAVAAGQRVAGYDVMSAAGSGTGVIPVSVAVNEGKCQVTLPGEDDTELDPGLIARFRTTSQSGLADMASMSSVADMATRIGDQLWRCGLARALDLARGDDPDRPVRLLWSCDAETDDLPWELVHPTMSPLGWFADPPVTSVRSVRRRHAAGHGADRPASTPMTRYRMQVIRGTGSELDSSEDAYAQTSRRTRLRNVRMLNPQPVRIAIRQDLDEALREPVDILQVWAHCGRDGAVFADNAQFGAADLADRVAPQVSRLAVIVGCRSGTLARALVERGVEAVVAMRTEVFSGTVQPLVADLIALALGGDPIDIAFGKALRSYVLTGQPGAAAVPMLYLADGSTGELFG
jgi:hypothetical protein